MTTGIIPHVLSCPRFLRKPRLLTRFSALPRGRACTQWSAPDLPRRFESKSGLLANLAWSGG
jgi:hypothetical protein